MFLPDPAPAGEAPPRPLPRLTTTERNAVERARVDADRFGWDGGARRHRLIRVRPVRPLADPRLERLRLFACMMRRGDARAGRLAEVLLADGFGETALREAVGLALA